MLAKAGAHACAGETTLFETVVYAEIHSLNLWDASLLEGDTISSTFRLYVNIGPNIVVLGGSVGAGSVWCMHNWCWTARITVCVSDFQRGVLTKKVHMKWCRLAHVRLWLEKCQRSFPRTRRAMTNASTPSQCPPISELGRLIFILSVSLTSSKPTPRQEARVMLRSSVGGDKALP